MKRILVILISILTLSSQTMAYEEANYEVVKENKEYEIRKYSDRLVIETNSIEGGYYAVIEYSGRSSDKNFLKNKDILEKLLRQDNITILSPPIRASYNSPFTLPMLKRNEVMYRINL